ncbi:hypothetical protein PMAYCL1PPCAC_19946, partial [Pristionchus mayeri]
TFWAHLPTEKNRKVLCALFHLGLRLNKGLGYYSRCRMSTAATTRIMLHLLMKTKLSRKERKPALSLLQKMLDWNRAEENGGRVVLMGIRMIQKHY